MITTGLVDDPLSADSQIALNLSSNVLSQQVDGIRGFLLVYLDQIWEAVSKNSRQYFCKWSFTL